MRLTILFIFQVCLVQLVLRSIMWTEYEPQAFTFLSISPWKMLLGTHSARKTLFYAKTMYRCKPLHVCTRQLVYFHAIEFVHKLIMFNVLYTLFFALFWKVTLRNNIHTKLHTSQVLISGKLCVLKLAQQHVLLCKLWFE